VKEVEQKKINVMKNLSNIIKESTDRKVSSHGQKLNDTVQQLINKL